MHPRRAGGRRGGALVALCALLALLLPLSACTSEGGAVPTPTVPPSTAGSTEVRFPTTDGLTLDGRLFGGSGSRLAIVLHEYDGDQSDWYALARTVARGDGAAVLTFDFRGYGASGGRRSTGTGLVTDALAAVAFAQGRGYRSIVLVGAGMGSTAGIIAASRDAAIDGVIGISPAAHFGGLDAVQAIRDRRPAMMLLGTEGDLSALDSMHTLEQVAQLPANDVHVLPGNSHGAAIFASSEGATATSLVEAELRTMWAAR